jgi:hypothetical protein
MDNSLKPIEHFVDQGLAQRFQQVFGFPLVFSNSPDKRASAKKALGIGLKYPFAFATVTGDAINNTTYRPHALWRKGLVSGISTDGTHAYRLNLIPVTTKFEITFVAESLTEIRRQAKLWLLGSVQSALKFSITYAVTDLDIHVEQDQELSIPTREGGLDEPLEYTMVSNLSVHGYMSADKLKKAQIVTDVELQGYLGSKASIEGLPPQQVAEHRVFFFDSREPTATTPEEVAATTADPTKITDEALREEIDDTSFTEVEEGFDGLHETLTELPPDWSL